jgi:protein-L-isoaspartate(D-aspartate) O-methyltransferase
MNNYSLARKNMVDCQIQPSGVIHAGVLNAFGSVPREKFLPANIQPVAYSDEMLPLSQGRMLLEPAVHARLLQFAEPKAGDHALDIGGGNGYAPVILASLVKTVVEVESPDFLSRAQALWRELGVTNIEGVASDLKAGAPAKAPYDLIFLNGAAADIPLTIANQLSSEGRLMMILQKPDAALGQATLVRRSGAAGFSAYALFETSSPYLSGFSPITSFQF